MQILWLKHILRFPTLNFWNDNSSYNKAYVKHVPRQVQFQFFFKFRTMTIPIIVIIYIFTYFFSLHYFNYSTCYYSMVLCDPKKRAPTRQSPFWRQNKDYVGRAIHGSSNWLYNMCKCTIIFNIIFLATAATAAV